MLQFGGVEVLLKKISVIIEMDNITYRETRKL